MIVYRDMTFCTAKCDSEKCFRKLTKEIIKQANDYGLPICQADFTDVCLYIKNKEGNKTNE